MFKTYPFDDVWLKTMGQPITTGCWLIWGQEKNGKTWFALKLADYLSRFGKVLYVSGEEGVCKTFVDACARAGISEDNRKIKFIPETPMEELRKLMLKRKSAEVVVMDNMTIYANDLKGGALRQLLKDFPNKLFIFIAHEDRKQPYTSPAKLCRRLASIIIHVEGLAANVSGRCPGGRLYIDESTASLYWGTPEQNDQVSPKNPQP